MTVTTTKRVIMSYHRQTEVWKQQGNILYQIHNTWIRYFRKHNLTRVLEIEAELKPIDLKYFEHTDGKFTVVNGQFQMKEGMTEEDYQKETSVILDVEIQANIL